MTSEITPGTGPDPSTPLASSSYQALLAGAITVLTEAARLGHPSWREHGRAEPVDWAEFVALALAGAAANVGGTEVALAGRPGSWEAAAVRQLLAGTVGGDDQQLLGHRTEDILVEAFVDEILDEQGVTSGYDLARDLLRQRLKAAGPPAHLGDGSRGAREREREAVDLLADQLDELQHRDWAEYGQNLAANIRAAADSRDGLRVPVVISVDLTTGGRGTTDDPDRPWTVADELLAEAIFATPRPGDGRSPLDRLVIDRGPGAAAAPAVRSAPARQTPGTATGSLQRVAPKGQRDIGR
jgi:hypothetical protein